MGDARSADRPLVGQARHGEARGQRRRRAVRLVLQEDRTADAGEPRASADEARPQLRDRVRGPGIEAAGPLHERPGEQDFSPGAGRPR